MAMPPAQAFSLLCRTVADITAKNTTDGHNMPLLLLFRIIVSQRNLLFPHTASETRALASYMTSSFQSPKLDEAVKILADAFRVPASSLDVTACVKVRLWLVLRAPFAVGVGLYSGMGEGCVACRRRRYRRHVITVRCECPVHVCDLCSRSFFHGFFTCPVAEARAQPTG